MQVDESKRVDLDLGVMGEDNQEDQVDPEVHGEPIREEIACAPEDEHDLGEPTTQEAQAPKALMSPVTPTQQEIDEHYLNHLPYRNWCQCCVMGRAKEDPHKKVSEESRQAQIPTIGIDFGFAGE